MRAKGAGNLVEFIGYFSVSHIASIFQQGMQRMQQKLTQNGITSDYTSAIYVFHNFD